MLKIKAIELLGGTPKSTADAIGVSPSAVSQWPDMLPDRIADRVLAALARKHLPPDLIGADLLECVVVADAPNKPLPPIGPAQPEPIRERRLSGPRRDADLRDEDQPCAAGAMRAA